MYPKAPPSNVPRPSLFPSIFLSLVLLLLLHCSALIASLLRMWNEAVPTGVTGLLRLFLSGGGGDGGRGAKIEEM